MSIRPALCLFFFNDTATTEIYTLSLHDALPILEVNAMRAANYLLIPILSELVSLYGTDQLIDLYMGVKEHYNPSLEILRSEEHTSELQSRQYLVCRLLLEKKNNVHGIRSRRP